jgi:hypothetical protein
MDVDVYLGLVRQADRLERKFNEDVLIANRIASYDKESFQKALKEVEESWKKWKLAEALVYKHAHDVLIDDIEQALNQ